MAEKFLINGNRPLKGEVEVRGAKNAAFGILAASILTKENCIISNLPLIEDVFRILEIMEGMGVKVSWISERAVKISAKELDPARMRKDLVTILRGSILLVGPLLARFGKVNIPQPGGCIIGARPITTHLDAFTQMGIEVLPKRNHFQFRSAKQIDDKKIVLNEFSVTATENIILFASLIPAKTIIKVADTDYQVQELIRVLKKMGVKIQEIASHTIKITGKKKLKGFEHSLMFDPIEAGTFIITAAATKGRVTIKNVEIGYLDFLLKRLKDFGIPLEIVKNNIVKVFPWKALKMDKVQSLPYPGLATDFQSALGVLATQAQGPTLIHDPLYESRLKYLEELNKMGAEIYFADPHRAIVNGPSQLYGTQIQTYDLRGGAALIIAGLVAKGQTAINNIYQIDRGYEKIEERLQKLGADIKRVKA